MKEKRKNIEPFLDCQKGERGFMLQGSMRKFYKDGTLNIKGCFGQSCLINNSPKA